ncbi:MAG TPA: transglutaminaseTgpA domain-containing protein, partial [Trebonia sp.]|nr:transglutaminaseTgpA domain-containing protein [Trebonia sp.]
DPGAQVSNELRDPRARLELTYTTTHSSDPAYLPIYTYDQLTDSGWGPSPRDLVPASPALPKVPGLTASGLSVTKQITTINLASTVATDTVGALPVPYPALTVKANGTLQADRNTLMVFDTGVTFGGLSYQVTSVDEAPTIQTLRAAPPPAAPIATRDLQVPAAYDPLKPLARSITKDAKTPVDKAVALQNYLNDGKFKYTLSASPVKNAATLTTFLEKTKVGYCEQFSYAMAVLARLLGIPSRVAYGFTSGTPQSNGTWTVTTHDAHAWPELYFQGYGWLRFEPTPNGGTGAGQGTAWAPIYTQNLFTSPGTGAAQAQPLTGPTALPTGQIPRVRQPTSPYGPGGIPGASPKSDAVSPWAIFGLVVAGLVVLAAVAPWCTRHVIRRRRWRRRAVPLPAGADRVRARDVAWAHAAWEELRDDLADYGAATLPSESPRTVAARASTGLSLAEPARAALGRIAMAEERARYAPAPADGSTLRADSATVRRAIAAAVPRDARWRARLYPASVVSPALNAVASAADLYRGSRGVFPQLGRDRSGRQSQG